MLCRRCGLGSLRNKNATLFGGEERGGGGGEKENVSKKIENRILLRSVFALLSLIVGFPSFHSSVHVSGACSLYNIRFNPIYFGFRPLPDRIR